MNGRRGGGQRRLAELLKDAVDQCALHRCWCWHSHLLPLILPSSSSTSLDQPSLLPYAVSNKACSLEHSLLCYLSLLLSHLHPGVDSLGQNFDYFDLLQKHVPTQAVGGQCLFF